MQESLCLVFESLLSHTIGVEEAEKTMHSVGEKL